MMVEDLRWWADQVSARPATTPWEWGLIRLLRSAADDLTAERSASARLRAACQQLVETWREGIVKFNAGVKDSPSYDLKRMAKERTEAFTICADELAAVLAGQETPQQPEGEETKEDTRVDPGVTMRGTGPTASAEGVYRDGLQGERCVACHALLKKADGEAQVSVRVSDLEEVISILVQYVDCPEVWADTIQRFEQAVGRTFAQICAAERAKRQPAADAVDPQGRSDDKLTTREKSDV